jgi:hypothetical protein
VVKAPDLKSGGVPRTGSNPVVSDAFLEPSFGSKTIPKIEESKDLKLFLWHFLKYSLPGKPSPVQIRPPATVHDVRSGARAVSLLRLARTM